MRKLTIAPNEAPTNTANVARATPGPKPIALPKIKPDPSVNILPGINLKKQQQKKKQHHLEHNKKRSAQNYLI